MDLTLAVGTISNEGSILKIKDTSDWTQSIAGDRVSYGLLLTSEFRNQATPTPTLIYDNNMNEVSEWNTDTPANGRYSYRAYAFLTVAATPAPQEGDVRVLVLSNTLVRYEGTEWVPVELLDVLEQAEYTSEVLEVPYLYYAYAYKNVLNLEYIVQVRGDISNGVEQNKLYYKRTDLDYVNALIEGAGYNWALGLVSNFYNIVLNLDKIIANRQIS